MRTTTDEWPEADLGCPLRSTYQGTVAPMFESTSISEAPPAFLRVRHDESRSYAVSFMWTLDQLAIFQDWFTNTLNLGMRSFMMAQMTSGIMEPLLCHITSEYSVTPQVDHVNYFRVEFDVMAYWRVGKSPDWS